jgi:hypothetical protein
VRPTRQPSRFTWLNCSSAVAVIAAGGDQFVMQVLGPNPATAQRVSRCKRRRIQPRSDDDDFEWKPGAAQLVGQPAALMTWRAAAAARSLIFCSAFALMPPDSGLPGSASQLRLA